MDKGQYICEVSDGKGKSNSNSKVMSIVSATEHFIEMKEPSGRYQVEVTTKHQFARWIIEYSAYPEPDFQWFDNQGQEIIAWPRMHNDKYSINITSKEVYLTINSVDLFDFGDYTLKASNDLVEKELKLKLIYREKPTVAMSSVSVHENEEVHMQCNCTGYPQSQMSWSFTPCALSPKWPTCSKILKASTDTYLETTMFSPISQFIQIKFIATEPGIVTCKAVNIEGKDATDAQVIVIDRDSSLDIWGVDSNSKIAAGDLVVLACGASAYNFTDDVQWYQDNKLITTETHKGKCCWIRIMMDQIL